MSSLPDIHSVARAVDDHYNRLQSLEAEFNEIYQAPGVQRNESGTLWLKKPGKMRWEYRSPQNKLFVADGRDTWFYLPEEKQVHKSSLRRLEDVRSPVAFLLGKTKLEKELQNLSFAPQVRAENASDAMIRGVPKGLEGRIRQILLEVTPEHRIARILIDGQDDSITEYRLLGQRENVPVAEAKFRFQPPAGTEIVNEEMGD
ncbi:MAG: outer membrane lipoprotein chaperone LolA [Acidobacteria bacterium]|nr:outer membrane lipoprotein chaperone LolA [Acidobacteriota bacterium]